MKEQENPHKKSQPNEADVLRKMLTTPPKPKKAKKKAENDSK
jgi:hypothetical protein